MRREHSRELGLHSYFRYFEVCAQVPPGARSAAAAMISSSGHGQLPGRCRCEGSAPARGARVRMLAAAPNRGPPLPELASKGSCLLRPLARLLKADRVRLLTAESGAQEQCPPATKGQGLAVMAHGRSKLAVRLIISAPGWRAPPRRFLWHV